MAESAATRSHKSFADLAAGVKDEVGDLIRGVPRSKPVNTYAVLAILFLLTGFLFCTLCLLDLIAFAFRGNSYAWILAFGIMGAVWFLIGSVFAIAVAIHEHPAQAPKNETPELRSTA